MPFDPDLNKILKEMWRFDEKLNSGLALDKDEKLFYEQNLHLIIEYYQRNYTYWNKKQ